MDTHPVAAVGGPAAATSRPLPAPARKSVLHDMEQTRLAIEMIGMGARLQVLEAEVSLPRERLSRLYKELCGASPPKGMLPFSTDWFLAWRPNAHASMLLGAYRFMIRAGHLDGIHATLSGFRMYREHLCATGEAAQLSFTRAWMLVRFYERGMLRLARCRCCRGEFVVCADDARQRYICGLCLPPARAGKGRRPAPAGA
ncbi:Flagellar transcriptional regulator FlhC (plasmid) [Cupriavidus taiwanensis]|uniref:Flagellar transcriptional regulator FlhC n=1 Tax=Cupriavidus taiwanensis TaxID=164546 RepID=A0A375IP35_9BURK|nr:flagellar transcriptional regulator FlhC [Cupriavidus taiwanensis]SOY72779.1 Flagellar transcriptional activator [Cupriavidus taiwanensis]SOY73018.1 Flagellar transcriptional activator [Cupriavidus taiwanensis]SOY97010.1 Flagellar transcriptional activator [Cupriavidus taiwanensis]SOZ66881.1 Flagellar transcriptional activator [Cupriavidus taiwanensis]SOZ84119.1 Flagellar transcriptional activator [Cupriavidus taiwanensis]